MANPLRGEAVCKAGDATYTLRFDANVFCELEDATGMGFTALFGALQSEPSFILLRQVFCAGLQHHHPGTTLKQAGDIMSDAGMPEINSVLTRVFKAILPPPDDGAGAGGSVGGKGRKKAGTGSNS